MCLLWAVLIQIICLCLHLENNATSTELITLVYTCMYIYVMGHIFIFSMRFLQTNLGKDRKVDIIISTNESAMFASTRNLEMEACTLTEG